MTYRASLAASYQVAFDRLAIDEPAALDLLTLAAHLAPAPIPFTLFTAHADLLPEPLTTAVGDPLTFASLTRTLRLRALARISTDGLQLHRLVQAILLSRRAAGTAEDGMAVVALRLVRETVRADPWNNPATWPTWRQLLPHVLTVTSRDPESANDDVAWLLDRAASYLQTRGSPKLARPLSERAFELLRRLRGEDHRVTLTSARSLAHDLHALGEYQQARQLDEDTLTRSRRILGEDHPIALLSANNLARDLHALGEHHQARQLNEDTFTRLRQFLGEDHPHTLASANNLANDLHALGEHEHARQLVEYVQAHRKG